VGHLGCFHNLAIVNTAAMVGSAGLRFLYSFLYSEYFNHIQVLNFLLLPYPRDSNIFSRLGKAKTCISQIFIIKIYELKCNIWHGIFTL
jgi:hypothetical protein